MQQTYTDFEIILVDDGSPDNSGKICDEYAKKDSRIKVIHKENGGVSSARNKGIEESKGEYICFIDSDDYIDAHTFENAVRTITNKALDLFIYGIVNDYYDGDLLLKSVNAPDNNTLEFEKSNIDLWIRAFSDINMASPCNKIYKSSIIKTNNISFDTACIFYEDLKFNLDYCRYVESVISIQDGLYHYRHTDTPQILKRKFKEVFLNSDNVYDSIIPYVKETNKKSTVFDNIAFQTYYLEMTAHVLQQENTAEIMKLLFTNRRFNCILKRIKKGKRIFILQTLCSIGAYKFAGRIAKRIVKA